MNAGTTAVINWYDNNADENSPYWSLWQGSQLMGSVGTGDIEACKEKLLNNLTFIYSNAQPGKYTIKLHDDQGNKRINSKSDYYSSHNFYPTQDSSQMSGVSMRGQEFPNNPGMQMMYDKLNALESDNEALRELINPTDEQGNPINNTVGSTPINPFITLINNPDFIREAIPRVMGVIDKFFAGIAPKDEDPGRLGSMGQIPGVDPYDQHTKLQNALQILSEHDDTLGDDLMRLATIARDKPDYFKALLQMLRGNG